VGAFKLDCAAQDNVPDAGVSILSIEVGAFKLKSEFNGVFWYIYGFQSSKRFSKNNNIPSFPGGTSPPGNKENRIFCKI
jgi:hypothetical protein